MFSLDRTDLQRVAISALGAVTLTGICLGGAIAPLHAAAPAPATSAAWASSVERKLDRYDATVPAHLAPGTTATTELALRFTADGDYAGASVARSSGDPKVDARALQVADRVKYPPLPATLRGRPQAVTMRLVFGMAADAAQENVMRQRLARPAQLADARASGQVASK